MSATPIRRRRATAVSLAAVVAVGVLGAGMAQAVSGYAFDERIAGPTRIETAIEASKALYPTPNKDAETDVVVVSQFSEVDGLTASYLAGLKNAPILYTGTTSMSAATSAELDRLGADNIWIVGGTTVIAQGLEDEWKGKYKSVKRYGGADRYATAAAVAVADLEVSGYEPERIFIANGTRQADALAVGPIAYARSYPILLTEAGSVPASTRTALDQLQTPDRTVVGGTTVVTDATAAALGATGTNSRLGGADRQATAVQVAEYAVANEKFTFKNAAIVGGNNANAADALVAAPLAGSTGTPLLFAVGSETIGTTSGDYLDKHSANLDDHGYIFGGVNAVNDNVAKEAAARAQ